MILPAAYRLTYTDWLRLPDDGRCELLEGELLMTPAPSIRHQEISSRLHSRLGPYLERTASGRLFAAPTGVRLSDETVVQPDLLVVLAAHLHRLTEHVVDGPPDVVVEILSPGSARRDLVAKRELYARAGVPEYWIVDSEACNVEVLVLDRGAYSRDGLYRRHETLRSPALPGLEVVLAEVFPADA